MDDVDADRLETMSGGACTPPRIGTPSPADSLFDSPRQLLQQLYHAPKHGSSRGGLGPEVATRTCPPIPGLHLFEDVISKVQADAIMAAILNDYDLGTHRGGNQVMLFGRARPCGAEDGPVLGKDGSRTRIRKADDDEDEVGMVDVDAPPNKRPRMEIDMEAGNEASVGVSPSITGLPSWIDTLLTHLSHTLSPLLPPDLHALLFPPPPSPTQEQRIPHNAQGCSSRQVIINHYDPGQGIAAHVDLLDRFGDGILILSLLSGTVMDFAKRAGQHHGEGRGGDEGGDEGGGEKDRYAVYLPPRSLAILHGPARYDWTHGIEGRLVDRVLALPPSQAMLNGEGQGEAEAEASVDLVPRAQRVSVTIRWLLPGADVVGV